MPSSAPPPPIVALDAPPPAAPLAQVNQLARVPDISARERPQVRQDTALRRRLRDEAVQLLVALEDHEAERRQWAFRSGHGSPSRLLKSSMTGAAGSGAFASVTRTSFLLGSPRTMYSCKSSHRCG